MRDCLVIGLLLGGVGLALVSLISFLLQFFIALKSRPTARAAWTAGLAYLASVMIFIFGGMPELELYAPLICLPGGLIAFLYWRSVFRRAWIENPDLAPEGVTIEDDDWQTGLIRVIGMIVIATVVVLARRIMQGQ